MTTIFDTVHKPAGIAPTTARVTLRLVATLNGHGGEGFTGATKTTILGESVTTPDAAGRWEFANVVPNVDIVPANTVYEITITDRFSTECYYIDVPESASPVWTGDILTTEPSPLPPGPGVTTGLGYTTPAMHGGDVQAALDATVDTVFLPAGTYTGTFTITGPKKVIGAGTFATKIVGPTGTSPALFTVTGNDVTIADIGFDGTGHANGAGIAAVDAGRLRIERCSFAAMPANAIELTRVTGVWINDCDVLAANLSGVRLNDPGTGVNADVWITNNRLVGCQASKVTGNAAIQTAGGVDDNRRVFIESNLINAPGVVGIGADSLDGGTIVNNRLIGAGATGEGIALCGSDVYIAGNSVAQFSAAGILWFCTSARNPNRRVTIVGNDVTDCLAQGIAIDFAEANTIVQDLSILTNRVAGNYIAIQSYAAPTATGIAWSKVYMLSNTLVGSTGPSGDFSLLMPEAVVMDNLTTLGPGTTNGIYGRRAPSMITTGAPGQITTTEGVHALHTGDAGSVQRVAAGFSILSNQAIAGFEAEKMDLFANHVRFHLVTSGGQVPQRIVTMDPGDPHMVWWQKCYHLMEAITPPGAQGANRGVLYVDTSAGATRLMCQFPTGAAVPVAAEPLTGTAIVRTTPYTGGNVSLTSTTWADLPSVPELVIGAAAGDWLAIWLEGIIAGGSGTVYGYLDAVTIVSGAPVSTISGRAVTATSGGVMCWLLGATTGVSTVGIPYLYKVVAGDVSGGNVRLRLRYRVTGTRSLNAVADTPFIWGARRFAAA